MNVHRTPKPTIGVGHVSQDSPKLHPAGVKHENAQNSFIYKEKYIFLSMFLPFTPHPPACVYARGGVKR